MKDGADRGRFDGQMISSSLCYNTYEIYIKIISIFTNLVQSATHTHTHCLAYFKVSFVCASADHPNLL